MSEYFHQPCSITLQDCKINFLPRLPGLAYAQVYYGGGLGAQKIRYFFAPSLIFLFSLAWSFCFLCLNLLMLYHLDVYIDVPDIIDLSQMRSKGPQAGEELLPEAGRWILLGFLSLLIFPKFTCHMSYLFNLCFSRF